MKKVPLKELYPIKFTFLIIFAIIVAILWGVETLIPPKSALNIVLAVVYLTFSCFQLYFAANPECFGKHWVALRQIAAVTLALFFIVLAIIRIVNFL